MNSSISYSYCVLFSRWFRAAHTQSTKNGNRRRSEKSIPHAFANVEPKLHKRKTCYQGNHPNWKIIFILDFLVRQAPVSICLSTSLASTRVHETWFLFVHFSFALFSLSLVHCLRRTLSTAFRKLYNFDLEWDKFLVFFFLSFFRFLQSIYLYIHLNCNEFIISVVTNFNSHIPYFSQCFLYSVLEWTFFSATQIKSFLAMCASRTVYTGRKRKKHDPSYPEKSRKRDKKTDFIFDHKSRYANVFRKMRKTKK